MPGPMPCAMTPKPGSFSARAISTVTWPGGPRCAAAFGDLAAPRWRALTRMQLVSLHEKHDIEPFLRHNLFAHLFEYSDLDDQYWPYTIWFGLQEGGNLRQVALLYTGLPTPVLMAN